MCRSDIANDAKKCPYCRSIQNWLFSPWVVGTAVLLLYVFFVYIFGAMSYDIFDKGEPFENHKNDLVISESKLLFGEMNCGPTVVIVGTIRNKSHINWEDIHLQINCYNSEDVLFDTEQDSDYSLLVPAGASIPFKVSFPREFPEVEYARHEVAIIHAKEPGIF